MENNENRNPGLYLTPGFSTLLFIKLIWILFIPRNTD